MIYQEVDGIRQAVPGQFRLLGQDEVGFQMGAYDASLPLTIDPVLVYSTYLGGVGNDNVPAISVDGSGNAYIIGTTDSNNFPTTNGAYQTNFSGKGVFVAKLNATGTGLIYSTYLGGNDDVNFGNAIAVDGAGNAYITGYTQSSNFPTTNGALQTTHSNDGGKGDAFVTKLNATGSLLIYSTYLGGNFYDNGQAIAVDGSGDAYITGSTGSTNFPTTTGAYQTSYASTFITKLNPTGTALIYSTFLGGNSGNVAYGVAVDDSGNAYVTGSTGMDFPTTTGAFQTSHANNAGGGDDAFISKLNPTGTALLYSTFLGGTGEDVGQSVAVDGSGNAYVTGYTSSTKFPVTTGAYETNLGGGNISAFVTKLNAAGTSLIYSTYLAGNGREYGYGIAVDGNGDAYVTGQTSSTNFPITSGAFQTSHASDGGADDAFVTKLNPTGTALMYSTYLGGDGEDIGRQSRWTAMATPMLPATPAQPTSPLRVALSRPVSAASMTPSLRGSPSMTPRRQSAPPLAVF